jgi:4-amino-4-deoxy-L-arabinose transferase-like glycosyltransferase
VATDTRAGLAGILASKRFLWAVLASAFVARLAWAVIAGDARRFSDSDSYIEIADNVLAGYGFIWGDPAVTDLWQWVGRPPLYPLLIAATRFHLAGREFLALYLVQVILSTATVALFALSARRFLGGVAAGVTALLVALDPYLIFNTGAVLSETLFTFFLAAFFYGITALSGDEAACGRQTLLAPRPSPGPLPEGEGTVHRERCICEFAAGAAIAGLAAGGSFLTRPSLLLLVLVFTAFVAAWARPRLSAIVSAASILVIAFLMVLPWGVRNHRVTGHWVFTTLGVGASLYDGLGPQADGSSNMSFMHSMPQLAHKNEYDRDAYLRYRALRAAAEDPSRVMKLAAVKMARFWSPVPNNAQFSGAAYVAASLLYTLPLYALAALALAFKVPGRRALFILLAAPVYFTVVHSIFVASARYRTPVMPFVAMLAAACVAWLLSRFVAPAEVIRRNG